MRLSAAPEESRSIRRNHGVLAEPFADATEGEQAVVGVDAVGEPPDHDGHQVALDRRSAAQAARERRDVPERPHRVGEADRRQAVMRLRRRQRARLLGQRRDRRQERAVEQPDVDVAHFALDALPRLPDLLPRLRDARRARERREDPPAARA